MSGDLSLFEGMSTRRYGVLFVISSLDASETEGGCSYLVMTNTLFRSWCDKLNLKIDEIRSRGASSPSTFL